MKLGMTLLISIVAGVAMSAARSDLPPERQLTDAVQGHRPWVSDERFLCVELDL